MNKPKAVGTAACLAAKPASSWDNEMARPPGAGNTRRPLTHLLDTSERGLAVEATRRVQLAISPCACGCGEHPRRWDAKYIAGHRPARPLAERLWAKTKRMPNGCLEWQGFVRPAGYGQIGLGRREDGTTDTHRAAWMVTFGEIPKGMFVCHHCDNRLCCDPQHLFLGSHADNMADMLSKGRRAREFRLPQTRISDEQVREIRALRAEGVKAVDLAQRYGISASYVRQIARGHFRTGVA